MRNGSRDKPYRRKPIVREIVEKAIGVGSWSTTFIALVWLAVELLGWA